MYSYFINEFKKKLPKNVKENTKKYFNLKDVQLENSLKKIKYDKIHSLNDVEDYSSFLFLKIGNLKFHQT